MMRFLQSLHYLASNARLRFLSFYACHVKYFSASWSANSDFNRQPLRGIIPMPRHFLSITSKTSDNNRFAGMFPSLSNDAGNLVLDLDPFFFELFYCHINSMKNIDRLEPGDNNRRPIFFGYGKIIMSSP